ncbi:MAG: TonB-dependent receptor [Leadbetterella sp.]|nr:TonB-dependent receptor [Leadbetterella sp.]
MHLKTVLPALLFVFSGLHGQKSVTVNGYIMDAATGEKLINANVYCRELNTGTTTNVYGFYSITVPAGQNLTLAFTYVGYENQDTTLLSDSSLVLDIRLNPSKVLKEVVISSSKERPVHEHVQMSRVSIPMQQIRSMPALLGEVDVLKALQLLPGVQGGTEGSAGLYVRGGGPDQNLYLLDGVPVYNVNHLAGFFQHLQCRCHQ